MYGLYLDCKNTLSNRICEKLYLNTLFSDVNFVFATETGDMEKVPSHKLILATGSTAMYEMFYGYLANGGDIPITNYSLESFREFLQFFYMAEVRLTPKNIVEVMNLCEKFKLTECLTVCVESLRYSLTIDDICWGYGIAISLKHQSLMEFCEEKLKDTTTEIFESESFLECDHVLLDKILTLVSSECTAIEIANACMKWAKAQCKRLNVLRTSKNMRDSLEHLFDKIPFDELTLEQLSQFTHSYKKIFTGNELKSMTKKILTKNSTVKKLAVQYVRRKNEHNLDCDRQMSGDLVPMHNSGGDIFTAFKTNKRILLKEFYAKLHGTAKTNGQISYDINYNQFNHSEKIVSGIANVSKGSDLVHIVLPEALTIDDAKMYFINIYTWNIDCIEYSDQILWQPLLKHTIQIEDIEISFKTNVCFDTDTIFRIVFVKPNIEAFDENDWIIINSSLKDTIDSFDEETISR